MSTLKLNIFDQELLLFDMGNTLLDFHYGPHTDDEKDQIGLTYMKEWIWEHFQKNVTEDLLSERFLEPWLADFGEREKGFELNVEAYLLWLQELVGVKWSKKEFIGLMRAYYGAYLEEVIPCEGAEAVLKELKAQGKKIGVISNCILYEEIYLDAFKKAGLASYIDRYYFSYTEGCRKPDKRLFLKALADFVALPEKAVMIGDSLKADMMPAKELGMKTVWINRSQNASEENHKYRDFKIRALIEMIK